MGVPYQQWITQQHTDALRRAIPELGLAQPDEVIANGWRGKPLKKPLQMVGWAFDVLWWAARNSRRVRRALPDGSIMIVHGDTMTTVLAALIGRWMRLPVAHIEAGLRSGNWRHPFPEELDRRIVGRVATIHYVPSDEAAQNLANRPNVVVTQGNTAKDAVRDAFAAQNNSSGPDDRYGLVLLHRYEFISDPARVRETLELLDAHTPVPLRLVVDSYSRAVMEETIRSLGLDHFTVIPKLEHGLFVDAMSHADFIFTDSGGIQQEAAALGIPTLIHRMVTEGDEGFGSSAVLSRWDAEIVRSFLADYGRYRQTELDAGESPSDIIVDDLVARGFAITVRASDRP